MLITSQFVKEQLENSPIGKVFVEIFRCGKRGNRVFVKEYWVTPDLFTDELLNELHGNPTYCGGSGKIYGVNLWFDGDSHVTFLVTKNLRDKIFNLCYKNMFNK